MPARLAYEWTNPDYQRFLAAGGVVRITVCDHVADTAESHGTALAAALGGVPPEALRALTPQEIDEATLHGPWYDLARGTLIHRGVVTCAGQRPQTDPYFSDLTRPITSASSHGPELWAPGGLAYAFAQPPYRLQLSSPEIQALYAGIISRLAPRGQVRGLSWHSPALLDIAPQLEDGTEWWGVFALSLFNRASGQVFGLAAAATD